MVVSVASILATLAACLLCIPVAVLALEILAGVASGGKIGHPRRPGRRPRIAALVPAHNEGAGMLPTLEDLKTQLTPTDRLLVVADNCSDDTARIAMSAGAEVAERHEPDRRGKSYALDLGVRHLANDPPEVLVIVDADCRLAPGTIEELAKTCLDAGRPVQAPYKMHAPSGASVNHQVAEFAWLVKNYLRPLGLRAMGLPCQLMGSGVAVPWEALSRVDLANAEVVEDLKLGLDLAEAGRPPLFHPAGMVTSQFAHTVAGADAQRKRWEHGHIGLIIASAPRLIVAAVRTRNLPLLALALDLAVPPLSLLAILVAGAVVLTGTTIILGFPSPPFLVSLGALLVFACAATVAWVACGRDVLPAASVPLIVGYVARKAGSYPGALLRRSGLHWIRTDRA